jgi:Fe-S-cluster containining protein
MDMPAPTERLNLSINTTSGEIHSQVDIPTGFIPITEIVPVVRSLGEQAQALEISTTLQAGKKISCQKGCGACCQRIMVPVSPPEAFALAGMLEGLPQDHRARIEHRLSEIREQLQAAGLLALLQELAESPIQKTDSDLDPINRAYYALRLPCIFLENDACSIYEHRPAACREYLVTSPPELCKDTETNPVQVLHIPLRAGTVLSVLWAELTGGPVRLMPLPVAFEWVEKHQALNKKTWKGLELLHTTLDGLGKFLHQTLTSLPRKKPMR